MARTGLPAGIPLVDAHGGEVARNQGASHIKPLFRQRDRQSMSFVFDLWSYDDVRQYADAILDRLQTGTMPCDGAWPQLKIDVFHRWVDTGKPSQLSCEPR
jgi:hypothetical protein